MHGMPALAASIDVFAEVRGGPLSGMNFEVVSEGVGRMKGRVKREGGKWIIREKSGDIESLRFVEKAVEITLNYLEEGSGFKLHIDSDLPPGSGLGSSSAVTTATVAVVSSCLGERLSREEISSLAYRTELEVQGAASRTGVNVASYGGFLKVREDEMEELKDLPELSITVGYTGKYGDTAGLVEKVRKLKEGRPGIIDLVLETIGEITESGIKSLQEGNLEKVGVLMDANQNLLEGLRVSSSELRSLIRVARSSGALGAKLTGAGGGGCMIALNLEEEDKVARAIREAGGEPIGAKIGVGGIRY